MKKTKNNIYISLLLVASVGTWLLLWHQVIAPPVLLNSLIEDVDTTHSIFLYSYDVEEPETMKSICEYHTKELAQAIMSLEAVKVENLSDVVLKSPYISLQQVWSGFSAMYSNGYWITSGGDVYQIGIDFEELTEPFRIWSSLQCDFLKFPERYYAVSLGGRWNKTFLSEEVYSFPGFETTAFATPDGFRMQVKNTSSTEVLCSNSNFFAIHLEVFLDGHWYRIPTEGERPRYIGNQAHTDVKIFLSFASEETKEMTFLLQEILNKYPPLPKGKYRILTLGGRYYFSLE